jgi:hypothetical protein
MALIYNRLNVSTGPGSEYQKLGMAASRERMRNEVLTAYGGRCACCGEEDYAFLTIDHVNEDGATHRGKRGKNSALYVYRWLIKNDYPDGFQVLCFNCNCARSMRGDGVCPHKRAFDKDAAQKKFAEFQNSHCASKARRHEILQGVLDALANGKTGAEVARMFGVHPSEVSKIKHGAKYTPKRTRWLATGAHQ